MLEIGRWLEPVRQGMMEAVLFGTARRARQPDMIVLGKTGTCSQDGMKLGWFAGYSQQEGGVAVAVLQRTSQPMGGGPHAAELAGHLFRKLADQNYFARSTAKVVVTAAPNPAPLAASPDTAPGKSPAATPAPAVPDPAPSIAPPSEVPSAPPAAILLPR